MFKNGQLVKCADGEHGIIELKSKLFPGKYVVTVQKVRGVNSQIYVEEENLKLIGNNFKFKGAK
nr:MAG: hypothetical protein [Bacteriophage sp.]